MSEDEGDAHTLGLLLDMRELCSKIADDTGTPVNSMTSFGRFRIRTSMVSTRRWVFVSRTLGVESCLHSTAPSQ